MADNHLAQQALNITLYHWWLRPFLRNRCLSKKNWVPGKLSLLCWVLHNNAKFINVCIIFNSLNNTLSHCIFCLFKNHFFFKWTLVMCVIQTRGLNAWVVYTLVGLLLALMAHRRESDHHMEKYPIWLSCPIFINIMKIIIKMKRSTFSKHFPFHSTGKACPSQWSPASIPSLEIASLAGLVIWWIW